MRRGFSVIEVLVGFAILGFVSLAVYQFQSSTQKSVQRMTDFSAFTRSLQVVEGDIIKDMRFLPPQDPPVEEGVDWFEDPEKAGVRCYDKTGAQLPNCDNFEKVTTAYFRAYYYKERVRDQGFEATSELSRIPVSRVKFRIEYKINNELRAPQYFSRLVTDVLRY